MPIAFRRKGATFHFDLLGLAYLGFYSRNHRVAGTPEEEFDMIKAAEAELGTQ